MSVSGSITTRGQSKPVGIVTPPWELMGACHEKLAVASCDQAGERLSGTISFFTLGPFGQVLLFFLPACSLQTCLSRPVRPAL